MVGALSASVDSLGSKDIRSFDLDFGAPVGRRTTGPVSGRRHQLLFQPAGREMSDYVLVE